MKISILGAGKLEVARLVEPFGMTWIHLAMKQELGRDWRAILRAVNAQRNARDVGITNSSIVRR